MAFYTAVRLETLQEGIKAIMRNIEPSYLPRRSDTWVYVNWSAPLDPVHRRYSIRWEGESIGEGAAVMNSMHDITMIIRAVYCCSQEELPFVVYSDKQDIIEALNRNLDPITPGLISVDVAVDDPLLDGAEFEENDSQWLIEYEIPITYKKRNNYRA